MGAAIAPNPPSKEQSKEQMEVQFCSGTMFANMGLFAQA
jgi:hypothetical protein